jgi:hypothetical protein
MLFKKETMLSGKNLVYWYTYSSINSSIDRRLIEKLNRLTLID